MHRICGGGRGLVAVLVALATLAGCQPARTLVFRGEPSSTYGAAYVTRDHSDGFAIATTGSGIHSQALATNVDSNTRMLVWPRGVGAVVDGESCATWSSRTQGDQVQQGAALRVTRDGARVRAVTVTQNIAFGAGWAFNVHTWDTGRPGPALRQEGQVVMDRSFAFRPFPWLLCARVIGDAVEVKSWLPREREPAWGDRAHGGRVVLPAGWRQRGQVGWYVGHLRARQHADFSDLSTWTYDARSTRTGDPARTTSGGLGALRISGT